MIRPVRIQLSRRAGFNLQDASRAINGLRAVNCARPGAWSNPFRIGEHGTHSEVVDLFHHDMCQHWPNFYRSALLCLPGRNLACWCDPFDPCHVDVLLDIFGRIEPGEDRFAFPLLMGQAG